MGNLANPQSFLDLQQKQSVSGRELLGATVDYADSGSSIAFSTVEEILVKNPTIEPSVLAECLGSCLKGVENQIAKRFPEDAKDWARFAYECVDRIDRSGDGVALERARSLISEDHIHKATVKAALCAVDFHRHDQKATSQALETGHLLNLLKNRLHPPHREDQSLANLRVPGSD